MTTASAELNPQSLQKPDPRDVLRERAARIAWGRLSKPEERLSTLNQLAVKSPNFFAKVGTPADALKDVTDFDKLPERVAAKLGRYASLERGAFFAF